jgi:hypothetical protein
MKGVLKLKKEKQKGTPEPLAEVEAFGRRERGEAERERAAEIPKHSEGSQMKGVLKLKKRKAKGHSRTSGRSFSGVPYCAPLRLGFDSASAMPTVAMRGTLKTQGMQLLSFALREGFAE